MKKGKFNKVLSRMESMYAIANPVPVTGDPLHVSDFIHNMFEDAEYGLVESGLTPEWFADFSENNLPSAIKIVNNFLQENGHIVSQKTIVEGIQKFNEGFENA